MEIDEKYKDLNDEEITKKIVENIEELNLVLLAGYYHKLNINFEIGDTGFGSEYKIIKLTDINKKLY